MSDGNPELGRRKFLTVSTSVVGAVGAGFTAVPFIASWQPSARAQAAGAPVEADISKLQPGQKLTVEWRGKPVWIIRRTSEQVEELKGLEGELRDPNSDEPQQPIYVKNTHRSIRPEIAIIIGICTHLGCSPTFRPDRGTITPDWKGGFFCPCHSSRFDLAGRVYQSVPAPTNLVVPPHRYVDDNLVIIGEDQEQGA